MRFLSNLISLILMTILLSACSAKKVYDLRAEQALQKSDMQAMIDQAQDLKELRMKKPKAKRVLVDQDSQWLYQPLSVQTRNATFKSTLQSLAQGYPVTYASEIPDDWNPKVVSNRNSRLIREHMRTLEMQANMAIIPTRDAIIVQPYKTVTYDIPIFGSASLRTGQTGTEIALSTNNLGQLESDLQSAGGTILKNDVRSSLSAYIELQGLIQSASNGGLDNCGDQSQSGLGDEEKNVGCFALSGSSNSLIVTTTPRMHTTIRQVFDEWASSVTRQAHITLKVMEIDVTDAANSQINLSLLRTSTIASTLELQTGGLIDVTDDGGVLTVDVGTAGYNQGSQLILQALNKISKVTVVDTFNIHAHNNRMGTMSRVSNQRFREQSSIQSVNDGSLSVTNPTVKVGKATTGTMLNILSTIGRESITMHIVLNKATVDSFTRENDGQITINVPNDSTDSTVLDVTLRDGQVKLLASSELRTIRTDVSKTDLAPIAGDSLSGETRVIQTVYEVSASIL